MRSDLEEAMAAVIASRDASARFVDDHDGFGREFSLDSSELAMLVEMGDDLTSLTTGFVNKRSTMLRWNARRSLELLGDEGEDLLDDFVEDHPQTGSFRNDAMAFVASVVTYTASRPQREPADRIIAEMARYEQHRSESFWDAIVSLDQPDAMTPNAESPEKPKSVALVAGANMGHFRLDMRLPYRKTIRPWHLLPDDDCDLLFFHSARLAQLRTLRVRPAQAAVLRRMVASESVTVSALHDGAPDTADVDHLLRTLSWEEAVEWR